MRAPPLLYLGLANDAKLVLSSLDLLEPLEVDLVSGLIGVAHREVRLKGYIN